MAKDTIRSSQLVTTFGPGALVDLPDAGVIISGLDNWNYDKSEPIPLVEEPRLLANLARQFPENPPKSLRKPPPEQERGTGFSPTVTAWEFPEWFVVQQSDPMKGGGRRRRLVPKALLEKGRFRDADGKRRSVVPVRFVQSCSKGHVDDIDWVAFVHRQSLIPCTRPLWIEERGTSGTLADTYIVCECSAARSMSQAARRELGALGSCSGRRPWLGAASKEKCGEPGRLLVRSASNAYFSQLFSVISIPDSANELVDLVGRLWEKGLKLVAEAGAKLEMIRKIPEIGESLKPYTDAQVGAAIEQFKKGASCDERPVKAVEFEALTSASEEKGTDVPDGDFHARTLPEPEWKNDKPWMDAFQRVVLVHRLREVVALVGFTRFEAAIPELSGELDMDVQRAPLARDADWLPAVENRGEGIFLQFDARRIAEWMQRPKVKERGRILLDGFRDKFGTEDEKSFYGVPFYMVHSFSHLLMTQISLECGYPASSLRERIYAEGGDQYGLLVFTGSTDAEGTLGGLVSAGRHIGEIVRRALQTAELCSNDPVCASQRPNEEIQRGLLAAACHGCLLVAETSCERQNQFLDRALVVKTMENDEAEFFHSYEL